MRWPRDVVETARQAGVLLLRTRAMVLLLAAAAVVAGVFAVVARRAAPEIPGDEFLGMVTYLVLFQFALPVVVMYLAVAAVHGDLEDRTATYLFVRPVRRSALLVGKWLAVVVVGCVIAAWSLLCIWVALGLPDHAWARGLRPRFDMMVEFGRAAVMAAAAYAAVGAAFAAFFRRPLVASAVFVVGWEFIVAASPPQAGIRTATVADPVRRWLLTALAPRGELAELLQLNLPAFHVRPEQLTDPLFALLRFTTVALGVALLIYTRREYDSRPRD